MPGPWEKYRGGPQMVAPNPMFPGQMQGQALNNQGQGLQNQRYSAELPYVAPKAAADLTGQGLSNQKTAQQIQFDRAQQALQIKSQFDQNPFVKAYRDVLPNEAAAMTAPDDAQGDLAVIYAFSKVMDPGSAVREGELDLANSTSALTGRIQSYIGIVNSGKRLPKATRVGLVEAIRAKAKEYNKGYSAARQQYIKVAKSADLNPDEVIGPHDGAAFQDAERNYIKTATSGNDPELSGRLDAMIKSGASYDDAVTFAKGLGVPPPDRKTYEKAVSFAKNNRNYKGPLGVVEAPSGTYANSYAGQGLSGANEGLASVLGAPADLMRSAINLVPQGINAVANTNIPTLPEPIGGGEWFKRRLSDLGSIQAPTDDPSKQFVRRVGQSVGASAVPALGAGGSLAKIGAGLLSGLGGGVGAATAQRLAPGNALAELAGELAGGGAVAGPLIKTAQRAAQRQIEAKVPTIADLKDQASSLYRKAENRGVAATADQTQDLADAVRKTLLDEGQLGPSGKITDANTNTSKAFNLIEQYAGRQMKPKEMNTVRTVLADSRKSPDPSDRRLGNILLDQIDDFISPLAPEFDEARSVASRYLQAQDLEQARELADARASQFTGSGFENALRTEYRNLDRGNIKGNNHFSPEVTEAIEKVARGTPLSNLSRGLGKLAPTGVVSGGLGSFLPGFGVASMFGGPAGVAAGSTLASLGIGGRVAATRMGIRAADEAELIARNGGKLPQAPLLPKSLGEYVAYLMATQAPKYADSPER